MSGPEPPSVPVLTTKRAGDLHAALHTLQASSCTSERRCPLLDEAWQIIEEATARGEQLRQNDR